MEKWITCGKFDCRIIGSNELLRMIPTSWMKYSSIHPASQQTISIYLEENEIGYEGNVVDGWDYLVTHGKRQAIYVRNGIMFFSMHIINPGEVIVRIGKRSTWNIILGIHYGIMLSLHRECIGLHGVTLLCGNNIIILSAPSGTGKTTLAGLLEQYGDAIVINGDFALLNPTNEGVIFEPTPFCGSSGRSLNHRLRVNRIIFLGQAKENDWRELSGRDAVTHFMSNAFVPTWGKELQLTVQENILKCISMLKVNKFDFAPTQEAAALFLKMIEKDFPCYSK